MEPEETFRDLPSELWMNVLLQGGRLSSRAVLASASGCSKRSRSRACSSAATLQECFAVTGCEPPARTSWRDAFLHCCRLWRGRPALPAWSGRFLSITPHSPYQMELEFEPPPLAALLESESLPEAEAPLRARRSPRRLRRGAHRPGGRVGGVWFTLTPASTTPRECKPSLLQ